MFVSAIIAVFSDKLGAKHIIIVAWEVGQVIVQH